MPYVLLPRDYCWLLPSDWKIEFRHPSSRKVELFVRTRRIKVQFKCSCGNTWTSMEGCLRIFIWESEDEIIHICIMLYQEECKDCSLTPSKDNTTPNRKEFAIQLKRVIYDYQNPNQKNPIDTFKANGKPKGPHMECEACRKKIH